MPVEIPMALKLYMDHHIPRAITNGLRLRNIDIVTAFEDNSHEIDDPALLDRAAVLGRVLFSQDEDLLIEAKRRQSTKIVFSGVIYAQQQRVSIGQCVRDLEIIALVGQSQDTENRVLYLPL